MTRLETPTGADQNSYWNDPYDHAPMGEWFIEAWGWLPSIQHMPGYDFYGYMTQDIDPEFLDMAYGAHVGMAQFRDAGIGQGALNNVPFQVYVEGVPLTVTWHSGNAPVANFQGLPGDPEAIVITASLGYFTVHSDAVGPSTGSTEPPPTGLDLMKLNDQNVVYLRFLDQALRYLAEDPLALQLMLQAKNMGIKINIITGTAQSAYDPFNKVVLWNPGQALRLTNGGVMSPAMVLMHELAHGVLNYFGADSHYDTLEDRRIIEDYERIIGRRLGEPIREDHRGTPVYGVPVTYHTPPPPPTT